MVEKNKQLIRDAIEFFGKGQYEDFLSYFSDDFEFTLGGELMGTTGVSGKAAWRALLQQGFAGNPEEGFDGLVGPVHFEIQQLIGEDNYIVELTQGRGLTKEGQREYNNKYCRIWEIEDGKIISLVEFMDTAYFNRMVLQS